MTKPLEQVKSELAKEYSNPNNLRHCAVTTPEEDEFTAFSAGFDSAISHLASVGVSGAYETSIDIGDGNELTKFIELLPVAAQLEQLKKQLAEAEKVIAIVKADASKPIQLAGYFISDETYDLTVQYFKDKGE